MGSLARSANEGFSIARRVSFRHEMQKAPLGTNPGGASA